MSLVKAEKVKVWFPLTRGVFKRVYDHVKAVDEVDLEIQPNEVYSLVGESGSGKSTLGYSLLGLTPLTSGSLSLDNQKIDLSKGEKEWARFRKDFQIIFQSPYHSLNPRQTIYEILSQPLKRHGVPAAELKDRCVEVMEKVELQPDMLSRFPHAFSGGQRQRINIARAIALNPRFIVCDEVVSALDVRVQATILDLLMKLKDEMQLSLLFISHDMGVVKDISDHVGVMYKGKLVEEANSKDLFSNPQHEYTQKLLNAVPKIDPKTRKRP